MYLDWRCGFFQQHSHKAVLVVERLFTVSEAAYDTSEASRAYASCAGAHFWGRRSMYCRGETEAGHLRRKPHPCAKSIDPGVKSFRGPAVLFC